MEGLRLTAGALTACFSMSSQRALVMWGVLQSLLGLSFGIDFTRSVAGDVMFPDQIGLLAVVVAAGDVTVSAALPTS